LLFVNHTPEIQEARSKGKMRPDSFVRIEKTFVEGVPRVDVQDFGKAAGLLKNKPYFDQRASRSRPSKSTNGTSQEWNGWLGKYQRAMRDACVERQQNRRNDRDRQ
jgi:hypothetical protein